ncbi:fimbrial usher protein FanD [Yersinia kristensenii ATCC 33638]|nr:fimbrial usher protein FanD [Yersinia kristensenii ATCC 33638]
MGGHFVKKNICLIFPLVFQTAVHAEKQDFNISFIRGGGEIPAVFKQGYGEIVPGEYLADIYLNDKKIGRDNIILKDDDKRGVCLSTDFLAKNGIHIEPEFFKSGFNAVRGCYILSQLPDSTVHFDYGAQALRLSIPQAALKDTHNVDYRNWDYGTRGVNLRYLLNANKGNRTEGQYYGSIDGHANMGRWVFSGNMYTGKNSGPVVPYYQLSTALGEISGDLALGKLQTSSAMNSGFGFYGLSLRYNQNMTGWRNHSYAPIISGVAKSNARITVTQSGYTLYSQMVPPGPYVLRDLGMVGNGDLIVTVREEDGSESVQVFPVTVLPSLLRPGNMDYVFSTGIRDDRQRGRNDPATREKLRTPFLQGEIDYGFNPLTLNTSLVLHKDYQNAGVGITRSMGRFGAVSASMQGSRAHYAKMGITEGYNAALKYAKNLAEYTTLQLIGYRYTNKNYVDFVDFYPSKRGESNARQRYEALFTHRLGSAYLNASYWTQSYWNSQKQSGASLSLSVPVKKASLLLSANYSDTNYNPDQRDTFSFGLSLAVPFSAFNRNHYSSTSVGYDNNHKVNISQSVSGDVTDRLTYNVGINRSSEVVSQFISSSYSFDSANTALSYSQDNRGARNMSAQIGGSLVQAGNSHPVLTAEQYTTAAVVNVGDLAGVSLSSGLQTNGFGDAVVNLQPYTKNQISVGGDNLPANIELVNSSVNVIPTERSLHFYQFNYVETRRYLLRVRDKLTKKTLPFNTYAITDKGSEAGFVSKGGVLFVSLNDEKVKALTLTQPDKTQCRLSLAGLSANQQTVQEVICEK